MRVAAKDSAGRERLLRYCARPMFAGERLVWAGGGTQVRYRLPWAALQGHRPEQQQQQRSIELRLGASEFLDRVAALIPPLRKHRHRYFGVLAHNSPWRALVAAQAACTRWRGSRCAQCSAPPCARTSTTCVYLNLQWIKMRPKFLSSFSTRC